MSTCGRCGAPFACGMQDQPSAEPCWCTQLPPLALDQMPAHTQVGAAGCLCPSCLRAWVSAAAKQQLPS